MKINWENKVLQTNIEPQVWSTDKNKYYGIMLPSWKELTVMKIYRAKLIIIIITVFYLH